MSKINEQKSVSLSLSLFFFLSFSFFFLSLFLSFSLSLFLSFSLSLSFSFSLSLFSLFLSYLNSSTRFLLTSISSGDNFLKNLAGVPFQSSPLGMTVPKKKERKRREKGEKKERGVGGGGDVNMNGDCKKWF